MMRSIIVIAIGLPGALAAGLYGWMVAAFSGDSSVSDFSQMCWFVWGVFGGACFGALPGLLVGWLLRVRWVIPILGGAIGTIPGLIEASGMHVLGGTNLGGFLAAACALVGFGIGLWIRFAIAPNRANASQSLATPIGSRDGGRD
jgi:hypothetical protein